MISIYDARCVIHCEVCKKDTKHYQKKMHITSNSLGDVMVCEVCQSTVDVYINVEFIIRSECF